MAEKGDRDDLFGAASIDQRGLDQLTQIALTPLEVQSRRVFSDYFGLAVQHYPKRLVCADCGLLIRVVSARPSYVTIGATPVFASEVAAGSLAPIATQARLHHFLMMQTRCHIEMLPVTARVEEAIRTIAQTTFRAAWSGYRSKRRAGRK